MKIKIVSVLFTIAFLLFTGCVTGKRMEAGGAYAATATQAAQPELFVLDASFDLAHSALDTTFKYERDNRAFLWGISPNIKHGLDNLRVQAVQVERDYALARAEYLSEPTPANLDVLQTVLDKLQAANAAALKVIQTKGNQ